MADRGFQEPAMLKSRGVAAEARGESGAGGLALIQTGRVPRADEGGEAVGPEVSLPLRAEPAHRVADAGSHGDHPQGRGGLRKEAAREDEQEKDHAPGAVARPPARLRMNPLDL